MPEALLNAKVLILVVHYLSIGQTKPKDSVLLNNASVSFEYTSTTMTAFEWNLADNTAEQDNQTNVNDKQHNLSNTDSAVQFGRREIIQITPSIRKLQKKQIDRKLNECTTCKKCFIHHSSLIIHEGIHTGEKPFMCSYCGICFRQSIDVRCHERIHTGEKPFMCSYCGICFRRSTDMRRHERIHTGKKLFKCGECTLYFNRSDTLKSHQKIHVSHERKKTHKTAVVNSIWSEGSQQGSLNLTHTDVNIHYIMFFAEL